MTNTTTKPDALAAAGASPADLNAGQTFEGAPVAPADTGAKPPKKEGMDETFAAETPEQKAKAAEQATEDAAKAAEIAEKDAKPYITLDDPAGQGAIDVLKESGVPPAEAEAFFAKAMASGDLTDIDWTAVEARIGKGKTFLVKTGVEAYYNNIKTEVDATVSRTYEIFGGAENWTTVKAWANAREATDPKFAKQIDSIRELLNANGAKAEIGARELLRLYNTDGGTKGLGTTKLVVGDATGSVIGAPLTRAEYLKEMHKANDNGAPASVVQALGARRRAGLAAGI